MSAATAGRITEEKILGRFSAPIAASTTIYAGTLVALDSNGRVVPVTGTTGLRAVGRACTRGGLDRWDNASGGAAAFNVEIEEGIFFWTNSSAGEEIAQAQVGTICYGVDDQTVGKTGASGTLSVAGIVRYIDSSLGVAVESSLALSRSLIAESNPSGIAFTQTYATASATVAAITAVAVTNSTGGSTADAILAVVTAPVAITDSSGGVSAATLNAQTLPTSPGSGADGTTPNGAQWTAAVVQLTELKAVTATFAARQEADRLAIISLTNSVAKLSVLANAIAVDILDMKKNDNKVIDALQASGIAS